MTHAETELDTLARHLRRSTFDDVWGEINQFDSKNFFKTYETIVEGRRKICKLHSWTYEEFCIAIRK